MKTAWIWMLLGIVLCAYGIFGAGPTDWQLAGLCLGAMAVLFEVLAVPEPHFGFFSSVPGLLVALSLAKHGGVGQAWLVLLVGLGFRTAVYGTKSLGVLACDLFCRALCLTTLTLTLTLPGLGCLAVIPSSVIYVVADRLVKGQYVKVHLSHRQWAAWHVVQNWTSLARVGALCLAPVLASVADLLPLYSLCALPLLMGLDRGVRSEFLRLRLVEKEPLKQRELALRFRLQEAAGELEQIQTALQLKALGESLSWELALRLLHSHSVEETARRGLNFLLQRVASDSAAVFVRSQGQWTVKGCEPAGRVYWNPQFEESFQQRKPYYQQGGDGHPFAAVLPLSDEGVLYCSRTGTFGYTVEECTLIRSVADQLGLGLQTARLFEEQARALGEVLHAAKTAAVGQLAAGLAHELNSPLAAIVLQTDLALSRLATPAKARLHIEAAHRSLDQSLQIVSKLLFYSREGVEDGVNIDLNQVITDTLGFLNKSLEKQGIVVQTRLEALEPMRANANQIQQLVLNLLFNARDAVLQPTASSREIQVATRMDGASIQLLIQDRGGGIPEEILERIFEPFFTTRPVGAGTGLGLSVALEIATSHGGTILASSRQDGGGASFLVEFGPNVDKGKP